MDCTVAHRNAVAWKRENVNYTDLASKKWVDKCSMDKLAAHTGYECTAFVTDIARIKENPNPVNGGHVRLLKLRKKRLFMGR